MDDDLKQRLRTQVANYGKPGHSETVYHLGHEAADAITALEERMRVLEGLLESFRRLEGGTIDDVKSAQWGRRDASSEWMREDDLDFLRELRGAFTAVRAALEEVE